VRTLHGNCHSRAGFLLTSLVSPRFPGQFRIIDANANRAREGLRVLEDLARFALDRADLCEAAKQLRHELVSAVSALPLDPVHRLASRDTLGDVGTSISTPAEFHRAGVRSVALAAAARTTEAIRCLEEAAKLLGEPGVAGRFERARYAAYTLEKDLVLALPTGKAPQWRLCVLITESLCTHHSWERVVEQAMQGGADCVQLREKSLSDAELLRRASRLVHLCHAATPRVAAIINDRPDIALLSRADGVHLGQGDLPIRAAREVIGGDALVGVSTSNLEEAREAARHGADYLGIGPMFQTTTKHKDNIAGRAYLEAVLADELFGRLPHLAIGGITPQRVPELAGVRGVAVSSVVCGAPDPAQACRALLGAMA
jgi:thiamine-phosphate pyrophosphorylase